MQKFEDIRFYEDEEVQEALQHYGKHPMIKALLHFTFPELPRQEVEERMQSCSSIRDFQANIIYQTVLRLLEKSSEGLSYSGFEKLDPNAAYLYISTHRDIVLDTSLLNCVLLENKLKMTASAIGDNLVQKPFLMALAKLNRNFLVKRGLGPREMLRSSQQLSEYIKKLLLEENRSVWMAQREGRTKDGNDRTQQGVLKMLAMAKGKESWPDYFGKLKIVPVAISYEFDPTDILKMPELLAKRMEKIYIKSANEDFNSILKGAAGQKGRIHLSAGKVIEATELQKIEQNAVSVNEQLQQLTNRLDAEIHENYRLWPSNFIACDILNGQNKYEEFYTQKEKRQFDRRIKRRVDTENALAVNSYLLMYANPVLNRQQLHEEQR